MIKKRKNHYQSFQTAKGGRMIALYIDMLDSKAGQILLADAKAYQLYSLLLKKYTAKFEHGILISSNKDNISIPVAEYMKYMTQRTFEKCIDKLIGLGFIKLIRSGYSTRTCNIYGFSDMWKNYDKENFEIKEEWKRPSNRKV